MPPRTAPEIRLARGRSPLAELLTVWYVGKMDFEVGVAHVAHVLRKAPRAAIEELTAQHYPRDDVRAWARGIYAADARTLSQLGGGIDVGLSTAVTLAMPRVLRHKGPALRRFVAKMTARVHHNDRLEREDARGATLPAQGRLFELPEGAARVRVASPEARPGRQALLREWTR